MSTSKRLILVLTVMVGVVMAAASAFSLRQREAALQTAMRNEVRARALTLQIALEDIYATGRSADAQQLINRLGRNSRIYGVILFDEQGRVAMLSDHLIADEMRYPPELDQVISTGEGKEFVRSINGQEVFSVILPIDIAAVGRGAFEIAQPLSFVEADIKRARRDSIITTTLLLSVIFLVVLVVMRHSLSYPIKELLGGAAAVGRGDLDYRVIVPKGGSEFTQLAREFNRMAERLSQQRHQAARRVEEKLALERELRHGERLASVGRLAAGVAHELGAPLNVIDARAEQLLARPNSSVETCQRNLNIIRAQVERITRIVRQLLDLARPYNLQCEPVDLPEFVANMLEQIEAEATRAGVDIEFVSGDKVMVDADRDFLRQVLLNVCLNGLQAMPSGGRLRIECAGDVADRDGRSFVALRIKDTGKGIAPENLAHIFDPFHTTKEPGQGTGLGLTVSHRIVKEHGGWIEAANHAEGGAIFTIYLPKAESLPVDPARRPEEESVEQNESANTGR
ncbi:MAG: ATP-binding protein [Acidobacteriota bacterium]